MRTVAGKVGVSTDYDMIAGRHRIGNGCDNPARTIGNIGFIEIEGNEIVVLDDLIVYTLLALLDNGKKVHTRRVRRFIGSTDRIGQVERCNKRRIGPRKILGPWPPVFD